MIACKHFQLASFDIWHPKYHEREVWLSKQRVRSAQANQLKITFTKAKSEEFLGGWTISRKHATQFPVKNNGKIDCYAIPLTALEPLIIEGRCEHEL